MTLLEVKYPWVSENSIPLSIQPRRIESNESRDKLFSLELHNTLVLQVTVCLDTSETAMGDYIVTHTPLGVRSDVCTHTHHTLPSFHVIILCILHYTRIPMPAINPEQRRQQSTKQGKTTMHKYSIQCRRKRVLAFDITVYWPYMYLQRHAFH